MELALYRHGDAIENAAWPSAAKVYDRLDTALAAQHLAAYAVETPDGRSRVWCVNDPSGSHTGTYLQSSRPALGINGETHVVQSFQKLCSFIAWRPKRSVDLRPDAAGRLLPESGRPAQFTAEWIDISGSYATSDPIDGVTATSVSRIRALLGAPAGLPIQRGDERMLDNTLTLAGLESQKRTDRLLQPGWVWSGERWVFAAPQGSVAASGLADRVLPLGATGLPARDGGPDLAGWTSELQAEELRDAALALREFIDLARTRSTSTLLLLFAFAAPLQLTTRSGVIIKAVAGSGKSLLVQRLAHFFAPSDGRASRYAIGIPDASKSGISGVMGWARGLVVFADDLRSQGVSADRVAMAHGVVEQAAQMAYGSGVSAKANPDGTLRDSVRRSEATVIVAGEELPGAAAISGRLNTLFLGKDDVATRSTSETPVPIDAWLEKYGRSGLASGLYADYLSWIASRMDEHGADGLTKLRQKFDASAAEFLAGSPGGREREIVGPAHAAWVAMRAWASDRGFSELLPDNDEVEQLLNEQPSVNLSMTDEVTDHKEILKHVQLMLQSRRGHFETQSGALPHHAERLGWVPDDRAIQTRDPALKHLHRSRVLLGMLSPDEEYVVLLPAGMHHIWTQEMKRSARFRREDIEERLGDVVPVDAQRRKKVPSSYLAGGNTVGIVLDIRKAFPGLLPAPEGNAAPTATAPPAGEITEPLEDLPF